MKKILQKLHNIQEEIQKMEKDGYNDFQRYNYLSETQITVKMKQLLDKHKVVFSHSSKITNITPFNNAKGAQNFLTNVLVDYAFYDVESGEKIRGKASGQGTDSGDKGVYKAITGAIKYIYMKNFLIPTGDDPENESVQPVRRAQPVQRQAPAPQRPAPQPKAPAQGPADYKCSVCGAKTNKAVYDFSMDKYGYSMCYPCQQKQ